MYCRTYTSCRLMCAGTTKRHLHLPHLHVEALNIIFNGICLKNGSNQGTNLVLTVSCVPNALDSGCRRRAACCPLGGMPGTRRARGGVRRLVPAEETGGQKEGKRGRERASSDGVVFSPEGSASSGMFAASASHTGNSCWQLWPM